MNSLKLLVFLLLALPAPLVRGAASDRPPNFLLILSDDHGWSQLAQTMDPRVPDARSTYLETPSLGRLMREGVRFTSGYAPAPLCTPTRRSILCGTSAARSGPEFVSPWRTAEHLTLPKALKSAHAAYRAAHFGKWGETMGATPEEAGYDASDGLTGNVTGGMPVSLGIASGSHTEAPPHFVDNDDPKKTRSVTDRAIAFMREQAGAGRPFYVQVSYYAVHLSVVAREKLIKKYEAKGEPDRGYTPAWAAMLEDMDAGVGRLLDELKTLGIDGNTYVVFTADNGGRPTIPGGRNLPTNLPLTGAKHTIYEGGIRVPFIARGPGVPAGSVCHVPVASYDLLPTFHALAGGAPLRNPELDGASLVPLLRDPAGGRLDDPRRALYFQNTDYATVAIRQGTDKLLATIDGSGRVTARKLFRVDPDPREPETDLAAREPARADELEKQLVAHLKAARAKMPDPAASKKKGGKKKK